MKFLQTVKVTYLAKPFLVEELKLAVNRRLKSLAQSSRKKIAARAGARTAARGS
jgi:hypothetical protein